MISAIYLALIVVSIAVIAVVLLQGKGGLAGGLFGGEPIYTSRRGVERTIFNITIGLIVVFIALNLLAVVLGG